MRNRQRTPEEIKERARRFAALEASAVDLCPACTVREPWAAICPECWAKIEKETS
jgi:hypothetical protein